MRNNKSSLPGLVIEQSEIVGVVTTLGVWYSILPLTLIYTPKISDSQLSTLVWVWVCTLDIC